MATQPDVIDTLVWSFLRNHADEAAQKLNELTAQEVAEVLSNQSGEVLLPLWQRLTPAFADTVLVRLSDKAITTLLTTMTPADCSQIISRLKPEERDHCFALLPKAQTNDLNKLMTYPSGTAGRVMDPKVLLLFPHDRVEQALNALRDQKPQRDRKLYLVDEEKHLLGSVDIQDLALSEKDTELHALAKPPKSVVDAFASTEEVAEKLTQFNLEVLPVIDVNQRVIGVIRHPALLKALQEESLTDIQTMVGVSPEERALSSPWLAIRKRLPWMQINLLTAFLAAAVIGLFESTIAQFTALAVLLPVVAGQSGNAGAQAQAVTMRGLALREVTPRNWRKLVFKEFRVGAVNGIAVALTTAIGVYLWSASIGLSIVISVAMVISMSIACVAGTLVPVILSKLGQDPAQSSSIVLTTVTDVAGFLSFLGIATALSFML